MRHLGRIEVHLSRNVRTGLNGRRLIAAVALAAAGVLPGAALAQSDPNAPIKPVTYLPDYKPNETVQGVIRTYGVDLKNVVSKLGEAFRKYHPGIVFHHRLDDAAAIPGLYTEVADIGVSGREPVLTEYFSFYETYHYHPTEIAIANGAFDVKGGSYGLMVYVHKDNPLRKLTMEQLDGIFGEQRTGGYAGFQWLPDSARGPEKNIRTWGQLGLKGEWANKPIQTYGYALTGMKVFFQQKVFGGGEKWNPNYKEYIETNTKQDGGRNMTIKAMLTELSNNKYGIGWTGHWQTAGFDNIRPLALAKTPNGPFAAPTRASFQDGSYPLERQVYFFINKAPGLRMDPKIKEFIRFVMSREGQEIVRQTNVYLPLTKEMAEAQLKKID